ncbi:MAG: hypothetical protein ACFFD2_29045, partial [Promethearchaeota archaeon]
EPLEKIKRNIKEIFAKFIESEKFEEKLKINLDEVSVIFQALSKNQISLIEFFLKYFQILSK